jgi:cysteinyl-tRNA synthetase
MAALGVAPADVEPKATEHVAQMVALIERLVARGVAYVVDGDVYFEVRSFPPYGRLSRRNLDELMAGARVEVDERKRDARDFALWKSTKPGEPAWDSPWGPGRPGWHIECSAMSMQYLGETFDLHGGGDDLIFPHHECEIAQSEAVTGKPLARVWMHNGMVNLGAEKMSKSLGNTLTIKSLMERHDADAVRRYLLATHYRNPLEFAEARIQEFKSAMGRLRSILLDASRRARQAGVQFEPVEDGGSGEALTRGAVERLADPDLRQRVVRAVDAFTAGMDDDFNTPQALAALSDLGSDLVQFRGLVEAGQRSAADLVAGAQVLWRLGRALGFFSQTGERVEAAPADGPAIDALLAAREAARKRRDWKGADEIRDQLQAMGFRIEDTPHGPRVVQDR